ncbi:MAG: hypothetical protein U0903_00235 [Planctomycetales bacterium]
MMRLIAGILAASLWLGLVPVCVWGQESALFVGDVEKEKDRYVGQRIQIEGRTNSVDTREVLFKGSKIFVRVNTPLQIFTKRNPNVAVTGVLNHEGGSYILNLDGIQEAPADQERLRQMRAKMDREKPEEFYRVGQWCRQRGAFYQDPKLLEQAREINEQGFKVEWKKLARNDFAGRMQLASRAIEMQIPESERRELLHEAFQVRREQTAKLPKPDWEQLAAEIRRDLPGTEKPLKEYSEEWGRKYEADPLRVYAQASSDERLKLHRLLWLQVRRDELMARLKGDQSNAIEIANQMELALPEFRAEAEKLREQSLTVQMEEVAKLTRADLLELREDYRKRKQEAQGEALVDRWLALRRKKLQPEDVEGLRQLVQDYEACGRDLKPLAAQIVAAAKAYPQSEELAAILDKMGYIKRDGNWLSRDDRLEQEEAKRREESREGKIALGMSATELRKSMGVPISLTRVVSAGQVQEVWVYSLTGANGLTLYLARSVTDKEAKVIAIDDLAPQ